MTDLTEKWKKGELPRGWYYVLLFRNEEYIAFIAGKWVVDDRLVESDITEVLAPVPSYQEYLESETHCAVYSDGNKRLKEDVERYASECAKLRKQGAGTREQLEYKKVENQHLKELLKECLVYIPYSYPQFQTEKRIDLDSAKLDLLTRINAVISESEQ